MKLSLKPLVLLLLCMLMLLPTAVFASDTPTVHSYSFTDADAEVDAQQIFFAVYDEVCDIRIAGEDAEFYFFYENIFRSTEKWRSFSASVDVVPLTDAAARVSGEIANALSGKQAYFVDFRDGDVYPGTASVSVRADDVLDTAAVYALYEYIPGVIASEESAGRAASVRPVASGLSLGEDGALSLTMTEAHDWLLVAQTDADALSAYVYTPDYDAGGGFFAGANIGWIVFFVVVGLGLAGFVIYLVTVKVIMKRRRKHLPAAKKTKR